MILNNNNPFTRVEHYPPKEPHDSLLNMVLTPSETVNGVSVNKPAPHPIIDKHLTSDLFSVESMLLNGINQDVKTVSFDSETPENLFNHFNNMINHVTTEPEPSPEPTPEPIPEPTPEPIPEPSPAS